MSNEKKVRHSGIELLKIIVMFGIVFYHCELAYTIGNSPFLQHIYIMQPTLDITIFIAQLIYYFGKIGNVCFLICSSWFLVDNNKIKPNKILHMISDVYLFSIAFLLLFSSLKINISLFDKIKCLFPTIFGNNWFITCYLLLYMIYPLLNIIINTISQKQHLVYSCIFFALYFCINSIITDLFFASNLIFFVGVYFIVAYVKKYMKNLNSNFKLNIICFFIGLTLLILLQFAMNFTGLYIEAIGSRTVYFVTNNNPIIFLIVFSLFNIFRSIKIQSNFINYISSLTILIYIIHENILFREYIRPNLMFKFWEITGQMNIVFFGFICSMILFIVSTLIAIVYNKLIQPSAHKFSDKLFHIILKFYKKFENFIFNL